MDALTAHQFGHANVVACMGTAVTEEQVGLVKRFSRRIVLALDADAAGQMATLRSLELLPRALEDESVPVVAPAQGRGLQPIAIVQWERKLNADIRIVRLPEGKDPDELIRRNPEAWPAVVDDAQPFLDFFIEGVTGGLDPQDARAKAAAIARIAPILQGVGDRIVQAHYAGVLARRLNLPESTVFAEIRRGALRTSAPTPANVRTLPAALPGGRTSQEDHLMSLLLVHREICGALLAEISPEDVYDSRNRELLEVLKDPAVPLDLQPAAIIAGLDDAVADHAERLVEQLDRTLTRYPGQVEDDARGTLGRLRQARYRDRLAALEGQIRDAQDTGDAAELERLRRQLGDLAGRHAEFAPPPSPYFRDIRSGDGRGR